jgi:phage minor structural protein
LDNYHPIKTISFKEYIGKENYAGFKYGINLKSVQRTIESESIVTKLVVKDNSNEFGKGGFCSIARAS